MVLEKVWFCVESSRDTNSSSAGRTGKAPIHRTIRRKVLCSQAKLTPSIASWGSENAIHLQKRSVHPDRTACQNGFKNPYRPSCMTTKTLKQNPVPAIPRSLSESPDYQPDWRHRTVEQYSVEIEKAADPSQKLGQIWKAEADEWVRQLLLFHYRGPCLIEPQINYALGCWKDDFKAGIAGKIKGLVAGNLEPDGIAELFGTDPFNIYVFEWLFFDVRDCPGKESLLRAICSRGADPCASAEIQAEARWIRLGLDHGPDRIKREISGQIASDATEQQWRSSARRIVEHALDLEEDYLFRLKTSGKFPSKEALQSISMVPGVYDFSQKVGRKDPPKPQLSLDFVPEHELYEWMIYAAKMSVFTIECLLHPSRSHLEEFVELPFFQTQLTQEGSGKTESARSRLVATLKQAFSIWEDQQRTLNSRWTYWLYNGLAKMAAIEEKNDPSLSSSSQPVIGKISWSKVFKEMTSPRPT